MEVRVLILLSAPDIAAAVVAVVVMAVPLVLAIRIDRHVNAFQQEAFGHLRKVAVYLRFMVWSIFLYYAGVLVGSYVIGDLPTMFRWPLPAEAWQIYARIGAAILGYVFAGLMAKELYLITVPDARKHLVEPPNV